MSKTTLKETKKEIRSTLTGKIRDVKYLVDELRVDMQFMEEPIQEDIELLTDMRWVLRRMAQNY